MSLLPLVSGKQGGIHHCHTESETDQLTQSVQPASSPPDRMRGHTAHIIPPSRLSGGCLCSPNRLQHQPQHRYDP